MTVMEVSIVVLFFAIPIALARWAVRGDTKRAVVGFAASWVVLGGLVFLVALVILRRLRPAASGQGLRAGQR